MATISRALIDAILPPGPIWEPKPNGDFDKLLDGIADNWELIGETQGVEVRRRGDSWINKSYTKTDNKKLIFAYKYPESTLSTGVKD